MTDISSSDVADDRTDRMHLVDLAPLTRESHSLDELLERTTDTWNTIYNEMSEEETLWVFAPDHYDEKYWPVGMAAAEYSREKSDFILKNIISRHTEHVSAGSLDSAHEEILFLVKNKREYYFNKDPIRIAHVYEGNEWGGEREKGQSSYHDTEVRRYNPEGKDPGNVWLNEIRDETADETVDEALPLPRSEAIKRCIRAGSQPKETVHTWLFDEQTTELIEDEDRVAKSRSMVVR